MRKYLFVLLIAAIICAETPSLLSVIDELELEEDQAVELKNFIKNVQDGIQWLKDHGYWGLIINAVKTVGKIAATSVCSAYIPRPICALVINFIIDNVIK